MPIDLVTVDDELTRRGTLEGVGGTNYLIELSQCMPSTVNARAYVQIVDEKATLRRMIKATGDIATACYQQTEAVSDILGVAEKSIFDIIMRRHEGSTLTHIADVLPDTYLRIEQLTELKGGIDGVPTGFVDLDNLLTGLHGGELVIVGARPSMGKTSFGMNMIGYAATDGRQDDGGFLAGNAEGSARDAPSVRGCARGHAVRSPWLAARRRLDFAVLCARPAGGLQYLYR